MPYLEEWQEKYGDKGFTVVGVHAPEFDFERDPDNVRWAMDYFGIKYPVVLDNHFRIWHAYANSYWPRKYVIHNGKIKYDHIGEGGYRETEMLIRELLTESNPDLDLSGVPVAQDPKAVCQTPTPETYCGFSRGYINNPGGLREGAEFTYEDPGTYTRDGLYLNGRWSSQRQYLQHVGEDDGDYLVLPVNVVSVNLVMTGPEGKVGEPPLELDLEFDGRPLSDDIRGDDVTGSTVTVSDPRMYNLIRADRFLSGVLKLKSLPDGVRLYAFSFGGCIGIP